LKEGRDFLLWLKQNTIGRSRFEKLSDEEKKTNTKIVVGQYRDEPRPEFSGEWAKLIDKFYVE